MILRDFESGGFPITRRSPVICALSDGAVHVAYNHFDLTEIIKKFNTDDDFCADQNSVRSYLLSCTGMWPGKKNTDVYQLSPEAYTTAPPEVHKEIDNALEIIIYYDSDGSFMKVEYKLIDVNYTIESKEPELLTYILEIGLKFKNRYAK